MRNPIIVGVALRDDDDAPLVLAHTLARLIRAPLALVTSHAIGTAAPFMQSDRLAAVHQRAGLALAPFAATRAEDFDVSMHVRPARRRGERCTRSRLNSGRRRSSLVPAVGVVSGVCSPEA